jgi:hypothetical protein
LKWSWGEVNDNPQRIRKAFKVVAVSFGLLVLVGLGLQGVEWVSSKVLAKGVERVHRAVGSLRAGMRRGDVEHALASAPALSRPQQLDSGAWSSHFMYTVTEACYVSLVFEDDRLVGVNISDANQPGHCPGAPPDWQRGAATAPVRGSCMRVAPQNNALKLTSAPVTAIRLRSALAA